MNEIMKRYRMMHPRGGEARGAIHGKGIRPLVRPVGALKFSCVHFLAYYKIQTILHRLVELMGVRNYGNIIKIQKNMNIFREVKVLAPTTGSSIREHCKLNVVAVLEYL